MILGNLALSLALPAVVYSICISIFAAKNDKLVSKARGSAHFATLLVSISSIMLIFAFVADRFNIEYVYSYSSIALPFLYKLSGIWAGLDGSLLFWAWLLTICGSIVALTNKKENFALVNVILQLVVAFFLITIVFEANPFVETLSSPPDGRGLNPLLQNFYMLIHPPALYVGYVGFTIPFAYVLAGLLNRSYDLWEDISTIRMWVIVSWLFLTVGNFLGAMWAYVELGWGGFWAWDPVENAGILPWFTACALLHSVFMQERRGMLKTWNVVLVILTFLLTIFGTFITRSGVIQSVHSFSDVTIGTYFLIFLALAMLFSIILVIVRRGKLTGGPKIGSLISREGAFYVNNILFIFALVAVMWGTVLPLFAEWFTGQKLEVGPPFFNRVMAPVGIALLFLTGICPEINWKKIKFSKRLIISLALSFLAGIIALVFGIREWFSVLAISGVTLVIISMYISVARAIFYEAKKRSCSIFKAKYLLFRLAPRRYGGYTVHFGIALLFIGIVGSAYKTDQQISLTKGEAQNVAGYELTLTSLEWVKGVDNEGLITTVSITKDGKKIDVLKPALFIHKNQEKPIAEIDFDMGLFKDLYLSLGGITKDEMTGEFSFIVNPVISFVWLGGLFMIIGTIVAILPRMRNELGTDEDEDLDVALGISDEGDL